MLQEKKQLYNAHQQIDFMTYSYTCLGIWPHKGKVLDIMRVNNSGRITSSCTAAQNITKPCCFSICLTSKQKEK